MKYPVLSEIVEKVEARLAERRARLPLQKLEESRAKAGRRPRNFGEALILNDLSVIAEVKFRSPSQGILCTDIDAVKIAGSYLKNGASAVSVLTEEDHFNGSLKYFKDIRAAYPESALLMKDFVIHEYQLLEASVYGADAALLIVGLLGESQTFKFFKFAQKLGLSSLVEVHNEDEMKVALGIGARLIGVNNRDLKTMKTSLDTSRRLAKLSTPDSILICESGIETPEQVREMKALGFKSFLIGTSFMKTINPGAALSRLIKGCEK